MRVQRHKVFARWISAACAATTLLLYAVDANARTPVLRVDFASNGSGDSIPFGGANPAGTGNLLEPGFEEFVVAELGPSNQTTANPSKAFGGITLSLTGNVSAWPGNDNAIDTPTYNRLRGDYLFLPETDGVLGASKTLTWDISGLGSNLLYDITFVHGNNGTRSVTFNSQTKQTTVNGATFQSTLSLTSNAGGIITGTAVGNQGEGNWAGLLVDRIDQLVLEINTTSGAATLKGAALADVSLKGYTVESASGALTPGTWGGLQGAAGFGNGNPTDGIGWEKLGAGLSTRVGEFDLLASSLLAAGNGTSVGLGNLFSTGGTQDLVFEFLLDGDATPTTGIVTYVSAPTPMPDLNMDGKVDIFDVAIVSNNWANTGTPGTVTGDANKDGVVDIFDVALISNNWNPGSASAVPEPSTWLLGLLTLPAIMFAGLRKRRCPSPRALTAAVCAALVGLGSLTARAATDERFYSLGDDGLEGASANITVGSGGTNVNPGSTLDSSGPSGAFVDIAVSGAPTYISVADRPGADPGDLGASFVRTNSDFLVTPTYVNFPATYWKDPTFFPLNDYPQNYQGLISRGMQIWAKPNAATQNVRQNILYDSSRHGLLITANNTWAMQYIGAIVDSGIPVDYGQWNHVAQIAINGATEGGTSRSVLYVNGVAIAESTGAFGAVGASFLAVGSVNSATASNTFHGVLDDMHLFLWGDNTGATPGPNGQMGQNYGKLFDPLDMASSNEWIAQQLEGFDPADVNLDGSVTPADSSVIANNWNTARYPSVVVLNGGAPASPTGDWISRQNGDLNFDGLVDLGDVYILHEALLANGEGGFDFGLLSVPEPSSLALAGFGLAVAGAATLRRRLQRVRRGVAGVVALLVAGVLAVPTAHAAPVLALDFSSDGSGDATAFGAAAAGTGNPTASGYTPFVVAELGPTNNVTNNASIMVGAITFGITGNVSAWPGDQGDVNNGLLNPLRGDYMFLANALGADATVGWQLSGLTPNTTYALTFHHGDNAGAARFMDFASQSKSVRVDGTEWGGTKSLILKSDGAGVIAGTAANGVGSAEGNWGGLEVFNARTAPVLTIDRDSGIASLDFPTGGSTSIIGYELRSAIGALNGNQWTSVADNYDSNSGTMSVDPDDTWLKLSSASDRTNIAESELGGPGPNNGATLSPGETVSLGAIWIQNPVEDIEVELLMSDGTRQSLFALFEGGFSDLPFLRSDLNFDGDVTVADWNLFKPGFVANLANKSAAEAYQLGDLNGDLEINLLDASLFAADYDALNGVGAFAAAVNAVPEPGSLALLCIACVAAAVARGRRFGRGSKS